MSEFKEWPKINRGNPFDATITEKINGTNACVIIEGGAVVGAQSRKRIITPDDDNYGFARWVRDHAKCLEHLGDGYHYGEWAGLGIQKNPHNLDRKKFFLFNTFRWADNAPVCCSVVPVLFRGVLDLETIRAELSKLKEKGSTLGGEAEGLVVYHHAVRAYTKHTLKYSGGKWRADIAGESA